MHILRAVADRGIAPSALDLLADRQRQFHEILYS